MLSSIKQYLGKAVSGLIIESVATTDYSTSEYIDGIYSNPAFMLPMSRRILGTQTVEVGIYKKTKEKLEFVEGHFMNDLFNNVSKNTSWADFLDYVLVWSIGNNNGVLIEKVVGMKSKKPDLVVYNPNNFQVEYNGGDINKISISDPHRVIVGEELENFLWIKSPNYCEVSDRLSQFKQAQGYTKQNAVGVFGSFSKLAWIWNRTIAKNGGRINGLFSVDKPLSEKDRQEIKDKYSAQMSGQSNNKPLVVGGGIKYQDTSKNPTDTDWNAGESKAFARVSLSLGVPAELVGEGESTYNNRKEAKSEMYTETIIPWLQSFCKQLSIFLSDQLKDNEKIYFDLSSIDALKLDYGKVISDLEKIKDRVTINEYRKILGELTGMNTSDIENGDVILVNGSMMALEDIVDSEAKGTEKESDV